MGFGLYEMTSTSEHSLGLFTVFKVSAFGLYEKILLFRVMRFGLYIMAYTSEHSLVFFHHC